MGGSIFYFVRHKLKSLKSGQKSTNIILKCLYFLSLSLNHSAVYLLDDFCILSNVPDACLSGRSKKKKN